MLHDLFHIVCGNYGRNDPAYTSKVSEPNLAFTLKRQSLLVDNWRSETFSVCETLSSSERAHLWYDISCSISIFLVLLMRIFDKVNVRLSFSPKYCIASTEKAMIKHLAFMY